MFKKGVIKNTKYVKENIVLGYIMAFENKNTTKC